MEKLAWQRLTVVYNRMEADLIQSALNALGIPVELFQESVGKSSIPVTFGDFGEVQIFVPNEKAEAAREWLASYERGGEDDS